MKINTGQALSLGIASLLTPQAKSFSTSNSPWGTTTRSIRSLTSPPAIRPRSLAIHATSEETDDEIEKLRSMAAKLRAEAAALESEQQKAVAVAAENAFRKFDTNSDGEISLQELKKGLEKEFKMELSDKRVEQLMVDFDKSGDGALQPDEFVGLNVMRNRLDTLAREERALSLEKAKAAQLEAEAVQLLQAKLDAINDREPTGTDKLVSILPYLFPLLDGLQFSRFLVTDNLDNPIAIAITILYGLYRAVPFGGLIAFFALNFLSGNPSINRLVRFNMQQAIFLDISLFFPGLIAALLALVVPGTIPPAATVIGNDLLFGILLASVGYCVVSSLLGQEPNKLPFISNAVENRMPTVDMFDAQGRFIPRDQREEKEDDNEKKD